MFGLPLLTLVVLVLILAPILWLLAPVLWLQHRRRREQAAIDAARGRIRHDTARALGLVADRPLHRNFGLTGRNPRVDGYSVEGRPFAEMAGSGCDYPECP